MDSDRPRGPLSAAEVEQLDSTLLPALERHHLRLLAHGLRSLQDAAGRRRGSLPDPPQLTRWALRQPQVAAAPDFAATFVRQLQSLGAELEAIAAARGRDPLELTLEDLTDWARSQADRRIEDRSGGS